MTVFDCGQQRVCVRVVYDGAASAGKTTNVRQLAELFATQRMCEVFSPAEMAGRTLYFDWLQIAAGMVCGFPLVCQIISVPGQLVLTSRRRHLLSTADVVVHVSESEGEGAARALDGLVLFDEVERERGERVPLVVQANKQDRPGALSGADLVRALGRPDVPVVEAIASDGIGVIDTFVGAVRAAVRAIQARVDGGSVHLAVAHAESADAVLERLAEEHVDPEWAVEMMLEEAWNAYAIDEAFAREEARATPAPDRALPRAITFPNEHVPTGFVWPAHTGRAVLRALAGMTGARKTVPLDADGTARIALPDFVLATSLERRFESTESARQALVRAARERTQLGSLLAPETVLVAQPEEDGASWLWAIVPRIAPLAEIVAAHQPEADRAAVLAAFGTALVDALQVEALYGTTLDLSPSAFGVAQGTVRYIGALGAHGTEGRDAGRALMAGLDALARIGGDVEPAIGALEAALALKLSPEERAKLAGTTAWTDPAPGGASSDVRKRIAAAFDRGRKAA